MYSIIPLISKSNKNLYNFLKEPMPHPPFRLIACGSSGSGKTNSLMNLILKFLKDPQGNTIFNKLFFFTPSLMSDDTYGLLTNNQYIPEDKIYATDLLDTPLINDIISDKNNSNSLVFIDDFGYNKKALQDEILNSLFFRSRHNKISVIITTQHYSNIPIQLRNNAGYFMIFSPSNKEIQFIRQEQENNIFRDDLFDEMIADATKERYSFLFIDKHTGTSEFYKNFEYKISKN